MGTEKEAPSKNGEVKAVAPSWRLTSLDALRGFTMLWIIGSDNLYEALDHIASKGGEPIKDLAVLAQSGWAGFLANQLKHRSWEGFVFYDLIFPMFVFIVGVSVVFSLQKMVAREGKVAAYKRIFKRFVLMFLLGVFYDEGVALLYEVKDSGAIDYSNYDENVLCGVLQRLALCYLFTSLLFVNLKPKALVGVFAAIMIGYWALLTFVPAPGEPELSFARDHNISHWIDKQIPPYYGTDPEGYFSTLPAVCSCLLGVFTAFLIQNKNVPAQRKALIMVGGGVLMILAGYAWGLQFPIIKRLWTSSYVLVTGGYSLVLLGLFYQVVDIWNYQKWCIPLIWIGANPLTIYMATNMVDFDAIAKRFVGGPVEASLGLYGPLVVWIVSMLICFALLRFLYHRKIFLRV